MPDVIEIRGLRALGIIGLNPEELDRAQPFEIDFDVVADLTAAGTSDKLDDTLDYGALVARAEAVVTGERHQLIERVAQRIAETLLADPKAIEVRVTVRKLRPPLANHVETTAVTVHRSRS